MKMKKTCSIALALSLALCSCGSKDAPAGENTPTPAAGIFTAGTYTTTGAGRNGDITVEVTFSSDAIETINITEHQETAGICEAPIESIPQAIIENQSLAVDTVAGATLTSQAIVDAVTEAVKLAGGDPSTMQSKVDKTLSTETVEMDSEVVVVGAGAAGMTTAIRLAQNGHQVILLEKMAFVGGATATCGGGVTAVATTELLELGVHTDPAVLAGYIEKNGNYQNDAELTNVFAYEIGPALDYLRELGIGMTYFDGVSPYTRDEYALYNMTGGGSGLSASLKDLISKETNIQLMLSTEAKELLVDENGDVTGVCAVATDGTTYNISAQAVVLATGSYTGNQEINDTYYFPDTINGAPVYLTGDGITMAQEIDAAVTHLEWVEGRANGIMTGEFSGTSLNNQSTITSTTGSIIVNKSGVRIMNEELASAEQAVIYGEQEDHCVYLVMDQNGFELFKEKGGFQAWSQKFLYTEKEINEWLDADSMYPCLTTGETIEEAAQAAGIDADQLVKTIAHYNEMVANGEDTDFGHTVSDPVEGQVYILQLHVTHSKNLGGLKANGDLQIVRNDGSLIGNLYGAGEVVGGSQGEIETGMLTWCLASGYHSANVLHDALSGK